MKKKKLISLVLAGTMVFGLAACGSNGGDKKSEGDSSDSDKVVKVAAVETAYGMMLQLHSKKRQVLRLNLQSTRTSRMSFSHR